MKFVTVKRILVAAGLASMLLLSACSTKPIAETSSSNGFSAGLIGHIHDCEVWRIDSEMTHYVYVTVCPMESQFTSEDSSYNYTSGKQHINVDSLGASHGTTTSR